MTPLEVSRLPTAETLAALTGNWSIIAERTRGPENTLVWAYSLSPEEAKKLKRELVPRGLCTTTLARDAAGDLVLLAGMVPPRYRARCELTSRLPATRGANRVVHTGPDDDTDD